LLRVSASFSNVARRKSLPERLLNSLRSSPPSVRRLLLVRKEPRAKLGEEPPVRLIEFIGIDRPGLRMIWVGPSLRHPDSARAASRFMGFARERAMRAMRFIEFRVSRKGLQPVSDLRRKERRRRDLLLQT